MGAWGPGSGSGNESPGAELPLPWGGRFEFDAVTLPPTPVCVTEPLLVYSLFLSFKLLVLYRRGGGICFLFECLWRN